MDQSNWINLGILVVTGLVGLLTWYGARAAAREARSQQQRANTAADRSAAAAQQAAEAQTRLTELEEHRETETTLEARRGKVHAERDDERIQRRGGATHNRCRLVLINTGHAQARNIGVFLDGKPTADYQEVARNIPSALSIGPAGRVWIPVDLFMGGTLQFPFEVQLNWEDDSGIAGAWAGTVA